MEHPSLPENVRCLEEGETFRFRCHPGVPCFTECCRQLDLALTPYDVLRLKKMLKISSGEFLEQYAVIEQGEEDAFPHVYLGMIDDGRASCPFVSKQGCLVYEGRPGACRTYPLGRAASVSPDGAKAVFHVLLTEPHCLGFSETTDQTVAEWNADQELTSYNSLNDETMAILQHRKFQDGLRLTGEQSTNFLIALYNQDTFRETIMTTDSNPAVPITEDEKRSMATDDTALLRYGIRWLQHELFEK